MEDGGYFPGSYLEIRQVEASMNRMGGGIVVVWAHILTASCYFLFGALDK